MADRLETTEPLSDPKSGVRARMTVREELLLAVPPTLLILAVLALVEVLSHQRVLFASLASSAFLIYLDPKHTVNAVRTLVTSHVAATLVGILTGMALGEGYTAAGVAMVVTIVLMITLDAVHPPAIATSLAFAFREEQAETFVLFLVSLGIVASLVALQRISLRLLARLTRGRPAKR